MLKYGKFGHTSRLLFYREAILMSFRKTGYLNSAVCWINSIIELDGCNQGRIESMEEYVPHFFFIYRFPE